MAEEGQDGVLVIDIRDDDLMVPTKTRGNGGEDLDFSLSFRTEGGETETVTYLKAIDKYFSGLRNLNSRQSHRLHAQFLAEATDRVRELIHKGKLDGMTSSNAFEEIAQAHQGRNPLERVLAYYDPNINYVDSLETPRLSTIASEMGVLDTPKRDTAGFVFGNLRSVEVNMSRGGGEFAIGVPRETLSGIRERLFVKVDETVSKMKQGWRIAKTKGETKGFNLVTNWRQKLEEKDNPDNLHREAVIFATAAATLVDLVHFKKDCNGRISEDWSVEIQRRIFGGMKDVRTWVGDNMRAKREESLVKDEYKSEIEEGNRKLTMRANFVNETRKVILQEFIQRIGVTDLSEDDNVRLEFVNKNKGTPDTGLKEKLDETIDQLMVNNPKIVEDIILEMIDGLDALPEDSPLRLPGMALVSGSGNYEYKSYDLDDVFIDFPPVDKSFDDLHVEAVRKLREETAHIDR